MRKIAGFLIFVGLILIGGSFYQKYVGDIPYVSNLLYSFSKKAIVSGTPIKVKEIKNINYEILGGEDYDPDIEEVNGNFNKSYSFNMLIGSDVYKFSFKYPENLSMTNADNYSITFGAEDNTRISFGYMNATNKFEEYVNNQGKYVNYDEYVQHYKHFYYKKYLIRNRLNNILVTNYYIENKEKSTSPLIASNTTKIHFNIFALEEKGSPFEISIESFDKKITDNFLMNFYNSFTYEKVDDDLQPCHLKNNKYVCSISLSKFDESNKKTVSLEFDKDLFKFRNKSNTQVIPSAVLLKSKEGDNSNALITFVVDFNTRENKDYYKNFKKYVEETIDGRTFLTTTNTTQENMKLYFYEIDPNIHVRITVQASEDSFDRIAKIFTSFKIE